MKKSILVPEIGEAVSKGTIVEWLKQNGDAIIQGEPLFELETDKATVIVPAPENGELEILVLKGTEVNIGQAVANVDTAIIKAEEKSVPISEAGSAKTSKPIEDPVVPKTAPVISNVNAPSEEALQTRVPMTALRKKTAERLILARSRAVHVTTYNEIDMSKVIAIRSHYQDSFEKEHGIKIGYMSFFVKACCKALSMHKELNAQIDNDDIVYNNYYDIGVAISLDRGLVVPVIRKADTLTFAGIESSIAELAKRARNKLLTPNELQGGTFTITNGGVFGSLLSTPVPAFPQVAIVGMHSIKKRAVVVDDQITIRPMMYVALTYDHRIVDGREAIGFLVKVKEFIEEPDTLLLEM